MTAPQGMKPADMLAWSDELDRIHASLGHEAGSKGDGADEAASTTSPDDIIIGGDEGSEIQAGNGDDTVMGGGGDDTIWGGYRYKPYELDGDDYLNGGAGNDWIIGGGGDDLVFGGAGNDRLGAGLGNNILHGGDGDDDIDTVVGYEEWGNDIVFGGDGDDTIRGYGDTLDGGSGNDRIYDAYPHGVWQNPTVRYTTIRGGDGDDVIGVRHLGNVDGGDGRDRLDIDLQNYWQEIDFDAERGTTGTGLSFANIEEFEVAGYGYADTLRGAAGNDELAGAGGDDVLEGRAGDDTLVGGNGSDRLTGGAGADTFIWDYDGPPDPDLPPVYDPTNFASEGIDRVTDFSTEDGDVLLFGYYAKQETGIDSYAELIAAATDTPEGVFIAFDETGTKGILLEGITRSELSPDDVLF